MIKTVSNDSKITLDWLIEKPSIITASEIASANPLPFEFQPNETQTLAKFVLNHTLPSVNSRGRAVTYPTQKRSINSIKFNPVNLNHMMKSNPIAADQDLILGFMLAASIEDVPGNPVVPDRPIPTNVYAVLWNRIEEVQKIIGDIETGFRSWRISMEAIRDPLSDEIMVGNQFTPITQASPDVLSKIGPDSTGMINDQKVALVIGGQNGTINYWGAAFTLTPADQINPAVQLEVASAQKKFIIAMPSFEAKEDAAQARGTSDQNNLPDAAFAVILPGGKKDDDGKTVPRTLRKLPHHTSAVKDPNENSSIDKPLLQNALARMNQINPPIFRGKAKKHLIAHAKIIFPEGEFASILQNIHGGELMEKEELKKVTASLSPELQSVIENSGIEAADAKKIIEAFSASMQSELTKKEDEIKRGYASFISKEDHDKQTAEAVASAVTQKLNEELPKAKEAWVKETQTILTREKEVSDAGLELTDLRKAKVRSFEISDTGNTEFANYLADLKQVKESVSKQGQTTASTQSSTAQPNKETASANTNASYGNLLNANGQSQNNLAGVFA